MIAERNTSAGYVFLSYASADRARALAIADRLEAAGIHVWIDRQAIAGGASWGTEIVDAIEHAALVVVCCSAAAFASRNVRQELQLAWRSERPYLPLRLDDTDAPKEVRYFLEGCQWVDVLDRSQVEWLPDVLRALAGMGIEGRKAPDLERHTDGPPPADIPTNLPIPLTNCLGREREIADVRELLAAHRLVTLTGPGGIGKTRLAIEIARSLLPSFPGGVSFVDLAPLSDSGPVLSTIAAVLGVYETPGTLLSQALATRLRDQMVLLVLDNFEHLLDASAEVGQLLAAVEGTRILVTSRAPLHLAGEREVAVAPLELAAAPASLSPELLAGIPSVALFIERARAIKADFIATGETTRTIAAICARLDGLPLAIELAAARVRLLSPAQILDRLERQLAFLAGGSRDRAGRQQTMREAIAWSEQLLGVDEQLLFRRLAVFAGGFSLEAAEKVAGGDGLEEDAVLDLLATLVEHSLVVAGESGQDEVRYRLLEPIRQYAEERLATTGETGVVGGRHARYYRELVTREVSRTGGPDDLAARLRLQFEYDNVRAALHWFARQASPEEGLRMASAIAAFWQMRFTAEGRAWIEQFLSAAGMVGASESTIANAHLGLGLLAGDEAEYADAIAHLEIALASYRARRNERRMALALHLLGAFEIARGDFAAAERHATEALDLASAFPDQTARRFPLQNLVLVTVCQGESEKARAFGADMLLTEAGTGSTHWLQRAQCMVALACISGNDLRGAALHLREVLLTPLVPTAGTLLGLLLWVSGKHAADRGDHRRAATLYGSVPRSDAGLLLIAPNERPLFDRALAGSRAALGDDEFEKYFAAGRAMSDEEVRNYILEGLVE